jgi:SAM-dependent methyltransferase
MFQPGGPSFVDLVWEGLLATERGYDHLAPKFDLTPFRTPDPLLDRVAEHLAAGPRIERVLDVCCGTGGALRRWAHLYDEGVGVDFSAGMLEQARQFVPPAGTTLKFFQTDVLRWTPEEVDAWGGPFDVVTSFGAFGHFEPKDQPAFLALIRHALRPGGRFVFVTGPPPSPGQLTFWAAHGFNAVMRARNAVLRPPFIMYYLTFSLPEALERCRVAGLDPVAVPLDWAPRPDLVLVEATRPA